MLFSTTDKKSSAALAPAFRHATRATVAKTGRSALQELRQPSRQCQGLPRTPAETPFKPVTSNQPQERQPYHFRLAPKPTCLDHRLEFLSHLVRNPIRIDRMGPCLRFEVPLSDGLLRIGSCGLTGVTRPLALLCRAFTRSRRVRFPVAKPRPLQRGLGLISEHLDQDCDTSRVSRRDGLRRSPPARACGLTLFFSSDHKLPNFANKGDLPSAEIFINVLEILLKFL